MYLFLLTIGCLIFLVCSPMFWWACGTLFGPDNGNVIFWFVVVVMIYAAYQGLKR